jgi:hypothetical protein
MKKLVFTAVFAVLFTTNVQANGSVVESCCHFAKSL